MDSSEARKRSTQNSPLYKKIMTKIERAVEDSEFHIQIRDENFENHTPISYNIISMLRQDGYNVEIRERIDTEYQYVLISWDEVK